MNPIANTAGRVKDYFTGTSRVDNMANPASAAYRATMNVGRTGIKAPPQNYRLPDLSKLKYMPDGSRSGTSPKAGQTQALQRASNRKPL